MSVDLQPHPLAFPYPINQIVMVPIDDLYDPDWNPRPIVDEGPLQNLIDFIKAGGYTPPILAWVGTGQKPWAVIAGKRRRLAYHRLGRTEVEVIFMDCTEAKAKDWSQASNEDDKPFWLGTYIETEAKLAEYGGSYGNLGKAIGKSKSWVGQAILITKLLSNESRKLIFDQYFEAVHTVDDVEQRSENPEEISIEKGKEKQKKAKTSDKKWFLTESVVRELLPLLNDRPEIEAIRMADQAIPFMLSAKMDMKQTARLVTLLIEGKTTDEIKEIFEKPAHVDDKAVSHSPSAHSKSDAQLHDEAQGADSPMESAHPKSVAQLVAEAQGADSPMESAHPKSVAQLVAEPQGAGSPLEPAHPKSVAQLVAEPQGASTPTESAHPKEAPAEDDQPKPKGGEAASSGFWKDIQDIFQGFTGAGLKDLFGKIPQGNKWQALGYIFEKILLGGMGHLIELGWKLFILLAKHTGKGVHSVSKSIANMV